MKLSELSTAEQKELRSLQRYGPAEDCRAGLTAVAAFESLAAKGLVDRVADETYINEAGRKLVSENA